MENWNQKLTSYFNYLPIELLSIITSYLITDKIIKRCKGEYFYRIKGDCSDYYNFLKVLNITKEIPEMVFHVETNIFSIKMLYEYSPILYQVSRQFIIPKNDSIVIIKRIEFENLKPIKYMALGQNQELKEIKISLQNKI